MLLLLLFLVTRWWDDDKNGFEEKVMEVNSFESAFLHFSELFWFRIRRLVVVEIWWGKVCGCFCTKKSNQSKNKILLTDWWGKRHNAEFICACVRADVCVYCYLLGSTSMLILWIVYALWWRWGERMKNRNTRLFGNIFKRTSKYWNYKIHVSDILKS